MCLFCLRLIKLLWHCWTSLGKNPLELVGRGPVDVKESDGLALQSLQAAPDISVSVRSVTGDNEDDETPG